MILRVGSGGSFPLQTETLYPNRRVGGRSTLGVISPSRLRSLPRVQRRVVVYLAVGVASFGTDFGLLLLLRGGFGAPIGVAVTVSYWTSVTVNYGLNRTIAFGDRMSNRASVLRYAALLGVNWMVTLAVLYLAGLLGVDYLLGKVAAVAFLMAVNYVAYARWVFPPVTR